jgi:hypothetical protein
VADQDDVDDRLELGRGRDGPRGAVSPLVDLRSAFCAHALSLSYGLFEDGSIAEGRRELVLSWERDQRIRVRLGRDRDPQLATEQALQRASRSRPSEGAPPSEQPGPDRPRRTFDARHQNGVSVRPWASR